MWGCLAKVKISKNKRNKIRPKTVDAIFVGYATNSSANRFLVVKFEISKNLNNTIIKSKDAIYFEDKFSYKTNINNNIQSNI